MFGIQLNTLLDSYQITKMERKQIKNMVEMNEQIVECVETYNKILLRLKTCTAMDSPELKAKLLKIIDLYDQLIDDYKSENRIQYDAVVKATNEPHYYILFMIHTCKIVLALVEQRNKILSDIICRD
jgi:hypothetical protein